MKAQLEALKKEIYSTLGTSKQQKMIHGFQAGEKMEQYKIICSLPGRTDDIFDYIGYPVQIRIGSGAYGSNKVLFRKADGDLIVWENQSFMALTEEQYDSILPLFAELIEEEKLKTTGYSVDGSDRMVGFYIEDGQNRQSSNTTTYITVKDANGQIKEQTEILD
jgi:hypothetical protein